MVVLLVQTVDLLHEISTLSNRVKTYLPRHPEFECNFRTTSSRTKGSSDGVAS